VRENTVTLLLVPINSNLKIKEALHPQLTGPQFLLALLSFEEGPGSALWVERGGRRGLEGVSSPVRPSFRRSGEGRVGQEEERRREPVQPWTWCTTSPFPFCCEIRLS
jgi:hypothetical protein